MIVFFLKPEARLEEFFKNNRYRDYLLYSNKATKKCKKILFITEYKINLIIYLQFDKGVCCAEILINTAKTNI